VSYEDALGVDVDGWQLAKNGEGCMAKEKKKKKPCYTLHDRPAQVAVGSQQT
jgi:hypothetical protein